MDIPNVLLVLMLSAFSAKANVKVTFTLKNYENRNNLDIRLRKCESFSFLGDNCDPYFHFSAYTTNANGKRAVTFTREVGPFMNKKEVANVLQATQIQQLFPDLIEIDLDIHDNDVDEDQRIAHFRREIPFLKAGQIELTMGVDVRITVILKVECLPDYFGERCDVYCTPMPDLWTCNKATGARVCSKPCIHGSCVLTNTSAVCVCADGWSGDLCMMSTKSSVISTIILPELPTIKDEDKKLSPETATKIPIIPKNRQAKNQEPQIPDEIKAHPAGVNEQSAATVAPRNDRKATSLPSRPHINSLDGKETGKEHGTLIIHKFSNSTSNITAASSTLSQSGLSLQTIILIVVILSVCWLCVMIAVGVVLYRRRRGKKGSNHLGSIWTNTNYEFSPGSPRRPLSADYPSALHEYQNTYHRSVVNRNFSTLGTSKTLPSTAMNGRASLPRIPTEEKSSRESGFFEPPPIATGSRIRFAATTVATLPPNFTYPTELPLPMIPSCLAQDEPYEELKSNEDLYEAWEPENPPTTPLTSFS